MGITIRDQHHCDDCGLDFQAPGLHVASGQIRCPRCGGDLSGARRKVEDESFHWTMALMLAQANRDLGIKLEDTDAFRLCGPQEVHADAFADLVFSMNRGPQVDLERLRRYFAEQFATDFGCPVASPACLFAERNRPNKRPETNAGKESVSPTTPRPGVAHP